MASLAIDSDETWNPKQWIGSNLLLLARLIPATVDVAGVAVEQLLGRDAVLVRFTAGSGWSD